MRTLQVISDTLQETSVGILLRTGNIALHCALDRVSHKADEGSRVAKESSKATAPTGAESE